MLEDPIKKCRGESIQLVPIASNLLYLLILTDIILYVLLDFGRSPHMTTTSSHLYNLQTMSEIDSFHFK